MTIVRLILIPLLLFITIPSFSQAVFTKGKLITKDSTIEGYIKIKTVKKPTSTHATNREIKKTGRYKTVSYTIGGANPNTYSYLIPLGVIEQNILYKKRITDPSKKYPIKVVKAIDYDSLGYFQTIHLNELHSGMTFTDFYEVPSRDDYYKVYKGKKNVFVHEEDKFDPNQFKYMARRIVKGNITAYKTRYDYEEYLILEKDGEEKSAKFEVDQLKKLLLHYCTGDSLLRGQIHFVKEYHDSTIIQLLTEYNLKFPKAEEKKPQYIKGTLIGENYTKKGFITSPKHIFFDDTATYGLSKAGFEHQLFFTDSIHLPSASIYAYDKISFQADNGNYYGWVRVPIQGKNIDHIQKEKKEKIAIFLPRIIDGEVEVFMTEVNGKHRFVIKRGSRDEFLTTYKSTYKRILKMFLYDDQEILTEIHKKKGTYKMEEILSLIQRFNARKESIN
ncbi:hypothetical protein [Flammeovirga sp. SubArs3]|uniref:hypothetical protein n=1 Tax=Flammeovirga sp. SubArs3 TaxID=2995316 RepID=UPI00248B163E|nr:hypothetical protein [Flammeovirga sp. SubArs3]